MKVIAQASKDVIQKIQEQVYDKDCTYRLIRYHKAVPAEEGILLYNLFTSELILISKTEWECLIHNTLPLHNDLLYRYLVTHWFLIPEDYDEKTMACLLKNAYRKKEYLSDRFSTYTILTTTDCNARCFYCYEKGEKRIPMEEQVAVDVAKFIVDHSDPEKTIRFAWFGGEPLFNSNVIDMICRYVGDHGFRYYSTMISNAYLFDTEMVQRAVDIWKLERVQVTLDGMADTYQRTKAYIHKDPNAFDRVISNIGHLLHADINVSIRMNVTEKNVSELYQVVDLLYGQFHDSHNLYIYAAALFENLENNLLVRTDEEREQLYDELFRLEDYIAEKGLFSKPVINTPGVNTIHCMADNPESILISPEGNLGSCEHHINDDFFGSIYSHRLNKDYASIAAWKEYAGEIPACKTCFYYPKCVRLKLCATNSCCNPQTQREKDRDTNRLILNTFERYARSNREVIDHFTKQTIKKENLS